MISPIRQHKFSETDHIATNICKLVGREFKMALLRKFSELQDVQKIFSMSSEKLNREIEFKNKK
jgi:hypothetical protein